MIIPDQLKPFLVHEDKYIRRATAQYFADSWSRDLEIIPLILDAAEKYGDADNSTGLYSCSQLLVTEASLDRLLAHLARTGDLDAILFLNRAIGQAPAVLQSAKLDEILVHPKLNSEIVSAIKQRCQLIGWSGERLWDELQARARNSDAEGSEQEIDVDYCDALVDALAPFDVPDEGTICELLRVLEPEEGWLEIFLVQLSGARRIRQAIPILLGKLLLDADFLQEECVTALARIGDPEASRLIRSSYPTAPEHFKFSAADLLGKIKQMESEEAIIELLEVETDETLRTFLSLGLCDLFSEQSIKVVRREIESGYDTTIVTLEDQLLTVSVVLGVELPEVGKWKQERDAREKKLLAILAEMARPRRPTVSRIAGDTLPRSRPMLPEPTYSSLIEGPNLPIRQAEANVGRNDPCPCGSGKKFKKCCSHGR